MHLLDRYDATNAFVASCNAPKALCTSNTVRLFTNPRDIRHHLPDNPTEL